jgi:hypothetical protein
VLHHTRGVAPGDGDGIVAAARVDNDDLVGPGDRFERPGDMVPFVMGDDRDGQAGHAGKFTDKRPTSKGPCFLAPWTLVVDSGRSGQRGLTGAIWMASKPTIDRL